MACANQSLFSSTQIVLVRGLLGRWGGRGEEGSGSGRPPAAEVAAFVSGLSPDTHLILLEGELRADNRYLKALAALSPEQGRVQQFARLKDAALRDWLAREARARGGSLDPDAADLLAARVPDSLALASQELDKLLCYAAPSGRIIREHVLELTVEPEGQQIFALIDAIGAKQAARVVELLHTSEAAGQAPEQLLALLAGRIRDLLLLATAQIEGVPPAQVAANAGWSDGKRYQVTKSRAEFTLAELADAHRLLLAADHALKSRPAHERSTVILTAFVTIAQRADSAALAEALPLGV